jgi:hypothetical protein
VYFAPCAPLGFPECFFNSIDPEQTFAAWSNTPTIAGLQLDQRQIDSFT